MSIHTLLLIVAIILWLLAAINQPKQSYLSLGWLGMFFYGLYLIIRT